MTEMVIMIAVAASSISSSSASLLGGGGAAFAFFKKRQADQAAAEKQAEAAAPAPAPAPAPAQALAARRSPVRAVASKVAGGFRRIGRRIGRAFKRPRISRAFKRPRISRAFKRPRISRAFKRPKIVRAFRRPRFGRRWCFSPETPIKLQDGTTVPIKNLKLGDVLTNGSIVNATMQIRNERDKYYRIFSKELDTDILVTGSHYIRDSNKYVRVEKFKESRATDTFDEVVSCIITNDHRIPVGEHIFWDWEDQKVNL